MLKKFTDHLERNIEINFPPKRIISLVPSQTELLFDLGLENEIVGVTKFCIHPKDKIIDKTKIGGTKKFNFEKIHKLKPDLIIANKEENYKSGILELEKHFPVWVSDIYTIEDNLKMILDIGKLCNKINQSKNIHNLLIEKINQIKTKQQKNTAAYIIWQNPIMCINKNTFINEMLNLFGFENVFKDNKNRYPEITEEEIRNKNPEYIFLSSEPFPFKNKHKIEFQKKFKNSKIVLVDGELFSWYGSRLLNISNVSFQNFQ